MTKPPLHYLKQSLFGFTYIALMGIFSYLLINLIPEQYYIITDSAYWKANFTPFPPNATPEAPTLWEYIDTTFTLILCTAPWGYNIYLILTKKSKKSGLILLISTAVFLYLYGMMKYKY